MLEQFSALFVNKGIFESTQISEFKSEFAQLIETLKHLDVLKRIPLREMSTVFTWIEQNFPRILNLDCEISVDQTQNVRINIFEKRYFVWGKFFGIFGTIELNL